MAIHWTLPEPLAISTVRMDHDAATIVLRRYGNPAGPRLVLSHGNGYAIDLYYPFWSLLAEDFDLIVHDLRSHGWNTVVPLRRHTIPNMILDQECILAAIDREFGAKPKFGIYHSLSALVSLLSDPTRTDLAARVLFDPPIRKPPLTAEEFDDQVHQLASMTRRRNYRFQTEEQMADLVGFLPMFDLLVPGVPLLMAQTTLRKSDDGEAYELRCPREHEAQIADYFSVYAGVVDFDDIACPTKVIGGDPTIPYSCLPTNNFSQIASMEYDFLPDTTHLLPLEKPQECADAVADYLISNDYFGLFTQ